MVTAVWTNLEWSRHPVAGVTAHRWRSLFESLKAFIDRCGVIPLDVGRVIVAAVAAVAAAAAVRVRKFKLQTSRVSAGISRGKEFESGSACSTLDQKVAGGTSYHLVQSPRPQLHSQWGYSPNQKADISAK